MSSIISGYNYDVFISYRQKDNKGDRWVSEFVDSLKTELESTFKQEISVYFDINPHDGLLETHDVNESLKEKLKCLVFIPIISRTYCDPKSFAWEHEFKAFVEQASKDKFGLKVRLPNGNVASRVLPILIHDLDNEDINLCESILGSVLRGVKFIYKEPGVNRPLTPDDEEKNNLNKTRYRNQINKVSNAIKEIITGLKTKSVVPVNENACNEEIFDEVSVEERKIEYERAFQQVNHKWGRVIPWSIIGLMVITMMALWIFWNNKSYKPIHVNKYVFNLPSDETLEINGIGSTVAFSSDGTKLIFVSRRNDTSFLFLKNMDDFEASLISGTAGAAGPFFSPDGKWVAFFAGGKLKKVSIQGGVPQVLCDARMGGGGCWGRDNTIVFVDDYYRGMRRVSSEGGTPEQITAASSWTPNESEQSHFWPQYLPDDKIILFTIYHNSEDMRIAVYSLETGKKVNIIGPGSCARYLQSGYLVYAWKGDLLAVPFNIKKMEKTGQPQIILKGVMMNNSGLAQYCLSDEGSLAYVKGNNIESENKLVFVNQKGEAETLNISVSGSPRISPNGEQILFNRVQEKANLWIYGLERGDLRQLTEKEFESWWAIWTPDGKQIVFNSNRHGGSALNLFRMKSDGTGQIEQLTTSNYTQQPSAFSIDGKFLFYQENVPQVTGLDISFQQIDGTNKPQPIFNKPFFEFHPILSPNGRWLAYVSDEQTQEEVYICSFPKVDVIKQISIDGGTEPIWAPDGKELYYRDITGKKLMAVSFTSDPDLIIGNPKILFEGNYKGGPRWGRNYDITHDGKRFLMIEQGEMKSNATQINIVLNWSEELKLAESRDRMKK